MAHPKEKLWVAVGRGEAAEGAQRWEAVVLFALGAECSSSWLGTGHGYVPQTWTLTLLPPGFRITVLYSTCWFFRLLHPVVSACLEAP